MEPGRPQRERSKPKLIQPEAPLLYNQNTARLREKGGTTGIGARARKAGGARKRAASKPRKVASAKVGLGAVAGFIRKRFWGARKQPLGSIWVCNLPEDVKIRLLAAARGEGFFKFLNAKLGSKVRVGSGAARLRLG